METEQSPMLDFLKAMTDADRLRIIGILVSRKASAKEIAERLNLPFREVINHLSFLEYVGVVHQDQNLYELQNERLEELARSQFEVGHENYTPAPNLENEARKILKSYLNKDGSIKQIPTQFTKLKVILSYVVQAFDPDKQYTEKEVNMILTRFHADTSGLRRDLVDTGLLVRERDGSRYWRPETEATNG
jgi:hypothetical protein